MSKRHDAVFDDVLSGLPTGKKAEDRASARFLKRSNTMAEQASGERQEKVLRLVDPADCQMWDRHNRAYELLTPENCADLIDGIKSQGQQEFPAIVRRLPAGQGATYEVICGARRHFAISWLRANNYPQFKYLIEERELTDEEAFRLADIENRDREDISDFERARDYAQAIALYYGGTQKVMAERLEVSAGWLSRYLDLARLPREVVGAFPTIRDLKELHARQLKPILKTHRAEVLEEAVRISADRVAGASIDAAAVLKRLKAVAAEPKGAKKPARIFCGDRYDQGVKMKRAGRKVVLEFDANMSDLALQAALAHFIKHWRE
ncbi:ParB/RepB/Spo0J family partition protein [Thalassovita mediterranea]|jgi:ParB family chromosome partitioning protein|uniref:Plasmid partition protein B n=1 Tax=Thalassovita mediterranea TaxID=340021 RepID=A0A0P1HDE1_9RHOB|nr:ParB/RepB/Spo0J family partition protein [Thalassovita mediterranea]MCG7575073.1 ParB/RepB/Spo0J family partition protein [Phaeobacter sp. CNT1-3]CUH85021.1 Plasmid partition protein B [Thalassovita mediterranea]SIS35372.1 chromosome partitioning protein, ParB family [Thalassovita mediterranea]